MAIKLHEAKSSSRPVMDMSASPKLKPRRKLQKAKKKLQEDMKMIKNKQGTVTIIAKYFQMGHQGSKKVSGRNAHENKDNTTMCQPRAGETAVSSTNPGQETATQHIRADQPMAGQDTRS